VKMTHRVPPARWWDVPESAVPDAGYQAEVDACTQRGEDEFRRRQGRLDRARARLAEARRKPKRYTRRQLEELAAAVELRREELETWRRQMVAAPASAAHRGRDSYRPVPPVTGIPL
jgi:hypothetical protein